ncbi:polyprenyl synthetase family protein [Dactylosporangium sp. NPDC051541]|uniref:polyprenyl synthetase family protein n=1 Tax=Dactylosporangium sp. NPDC051541 TaxID=3363977 RepID=UPI003793F1C9
MPVAYAIATDALEAVAERVDADLTALVARLRGPDNAAAEAGTADPAMAAFIDRIIGNARARGSGGTMHIMVRFPLLVHAAESGDPDGGRLAALIHLLWWTAARYLDDLADDGPTKPAEPAQYHRGILAALGAGSHLPVRLVDATDAPDATKLAVLGELARGWLDGIGGQLLDYDTDVARATPAAVLAGYRGKTGAPYAMAAAMAARLAGAGAERVDRWRAAGATFGVLRQLVNDRRDLAGGRDEDIANGTATFMVAHFFSGVPHAARPSLLQLHARAATDPGARTAFKDHLLDVNHLRAYAATVGGLVDGLHAELDSLGPGGRWSARLHEMVDEAMRQFPLPTPGERQR